MQRRPPRPIRRRRFLVTAVVVGGLLGVTPAAAQEPPQPTPGTWVDPAWEQARSSGKQVEVVSARDEDSRTLANPDGTTTMELFAGPAHAWDPDAPAVMEGAEPGGWVPIDTELEPDDGGLAPVAAARCCG